MSSQAGVFYFDRRPVPVEMTAELSDALAQSDIDSRGHHGGDGLFMVHAATWIDDLGAHERQPYQSALGNIITFDGRLDNRGDLLLRLPDRVQGQQTDTVLALAAYEAWDVQGFAHVIGDWSLVVWNPATRTITLASDYAGVRPLYYHADSERVVWSTRLEPLVSISKAADIDDHFVAGFLSGSGVPCRTPYQGILSIPTGQALCFGPDGPAAHSFWDLPTHIQIRYRDEREYDDHLRTLFRESVGARLRTRYPVCSELSGGLDSSSIACMASGLIAARSVEAPALVSFSFGPPGAPDEKFYTTVQRHCGIESEYIDTDHFPFLDSESLDDASPTPWGRLYDELARRATQRSAKVYLTGQGGDLLMGNWVDDSEQLAASLRRGQFRKALVDSVGWSKATRIPVPALLWRGFLAAMPASWRIPSRYNVANKSAIRERFGDSLAPQFRSRTAVSDPDRSSSHRWQSAPPERRKHFRSVSRVLESGFFRAPERLQHFSYGHPYAHRPLVEFLLAIPADVLCKPGVPRSLMRRAFGELLPQEVVRRRSKASFTGVFLKSVAPAAKALLAEKHPLQVVERGYVDGRDVRERLQRITHSLGCNEPQLRQIVVLELWLRRRGKTGPISTQVDRLKQVNYERSIGRVSNTRVEVRRWSE
jgi:asparagine synthase (glutamine-hydrolysing)